MKGLFFILGLLVLAAGVFAALKYSSTLAEKPEGGAVEEPMAPSTPDDLAYHMGHLQRFTEKLYFAGNAENSELATFYIAKIRAVITAVEEGGYEANDMELGGLMSAMLPPAVDDVATTIQSGAWNSFESNYEDLVDACNGCHGVSEYDFLVITVPERPAFSNQSFE